MNGELRAPWERLLSAIRALGPLAVAFSGGVDSTLLLHAAHEALGGDVLAVTASSPVVPRRDADDALAFCREEGVEQLVVDVGVLELEGFAFNPGNRCYLCKREMLSRLSRASAARGFPRLAEGSNADDASAWRPGFQAVREAGAASPLMDAGLAKADVRAIARAEGLVAWDKPASSCLATRFPHGALLTEEGLALVDRAEDAVRALGFSQVRVRVEGCEEGAPTEARVEVGAEEVDRLLEEPLRSKLREALRGLGFAEIEVDRGGYRMGSMEGAARP